MMTCTRPRSSAPATYIESGDEQGSFVRVEDDRAQSGGFLIIAAADDSFTSEVADNRVENNVMLVKYLEESNRVVP